MTEQQKHIMAAIVVGIVIIGYVFIGVPWW